ncbi:unnamed protein product [Arctia plantaginis]|uniref:Uncharacterized protein n=1 Tax=Arctia plantaginis TaxID=874455 RepID=A0A8S1BF36_ARCPL|nr:unnamed protein product [Arctia plantaginis]
MEVETKLSVIELKARPHAADDDTSTYDEEAAVEAAAAFARACAPDTQRLLASPAAARHERRVRLTDNRDQ